MELMMSGDLFAGAHRAPMKPHDAFAERVQRLDASPRQQIGDMTLATGTDDAGNLGLRQAGRVQLGEEALKVVHGTDNTAHTIKRKCSCPADYDLTVTNSRETFMTVGDRVRAARKARKLSQLRLAQISGLSQSTISDLERGRNTSSTALPTLASVLGVSSLWLSTGTGPRHDGAPIRPVAPQRQLNTDLMVSAWHAVTAYQAQTGSKLDDDDLLRLACRLYEQHIETPDKTASEMLGYLVSLTSILGRLDPRA